MYSERGIPRKKVTIDFFFLLLLFVYLYNILYYTCKAILSSIIDADDSGNNGWGANVIFRAKWWLVAGVEEGRGRAQWTRCSRACNQ